MPLIEFVHPRTKRGVFWRLLLVRIESLFNFAEFCQLTAIRFASHTNVYKTVESWQQQTQMKRQGNRRRYL